MTINSYNNAVFQAVHTNGNVTTKLYGGYDQWGGGLQLWDASGNVKAQLTVNQSGLGKLYVDEIYASVKNFKVENPMDPSTDIYYACPEGPEAAAYVRGTARLVDGAAVIELPKHFTAVASEHGLTVQLTAHSAESMGLAAVERSTERIVVRELAKGQGNYEFDFYVMAVRKG